MATMLGGLIFESADADHDGVITIEEGKTMKTEVDLVEGMQLWAAVKATEIEVHAA